MNFTDKTFEGLAPYEEYFNRACNADWCNNPGRDALRIMQDALDEHDGTVTSLSYNCGSCLLRIVKRTGYLYFADKEERASRKAQTAKPESKKKTTKTKKG